MTRKFVGTYSRRIADGRAKASGKAEFMDDICRPRRFPGMLYAKTLTCPYPHARIKSLDTFRAEALPGVAAVLTCFNPEVQSLKPTSHAWAAVGVTVPYDRWGNLRYHDERVLGGYLPLLR